MKEIAKYKDKTIVVSFSGGKTSAYMSKYIKDNHDRSVFVFMNTGQENEETLNFVNKCDKEMGLNLVWIEADINPQKGKGTRHTVVDYKTACRDHRLFEDLCSKYGLPNRTYIHCTRELKTQPYNSFVRSLGLVKGTYLTALGIRADEIDRISEKFEKLGLCYPLADKGVTKQDVNDFWKEQKYNLNLREHEGNCKWCYKKSNRKLLTLVKESPEIFDVPRYLEKYSASGSGDPRVIFRGRLTTDALFELAEKPFKEFVDLDYGDGCQESCEVFTGEE